MLLLWIPLLIAGAIATAWIWALTFGPFKAFDPNEVAPAARPELNLGDVEAWSSQRADILRALAEHVYGPAPPSITPVVSAREAIAPERAGGVRGVEQWRVELGAAGHFNMVLVLPPGDLPAPTIVLQNFGGNEAAFPGRPEAIAGPHLYTPREIKNPKLDPLLRAIFGRYVNGPPFALLARRGYAVAMVYGGDIVPDHPPEARAALAKFAPDDTGALSAWAWVYSRALDVLLADERLDPLRMAAWGQSRQGKAALLAGARDERFAAVVGLQAGRGGDALTQHRSGESVRAATRMFPHWFTPRFASYAEAEPPVGQHQMLALIAPRHLLIGRARNDAWADPLGGRAALAGAAPIFDLHGAPQPREYARRGRHGIYLRDWVETLDFLGARLAR